jgi:hypothetical protein
MLPYLLRLSRARGQSGPLLQPLNFVFCTNETHVIKLSLTSEKTSKKKGDCRSINKYCSVFDHNKIERMGLPEYQSAFLAGRRSCNRPALDRGKWYGPSRQAACTVHHVQNHTLRWVTLLQPAKRAAVLGQPSSLPPHCSQLTEELSRYAHQFFLGSSVLKCCAVFVHLVRVSPNFTSLHNVKLIFVD